MKMIVSILCLLAFGCGTVVSAQDVGFTAHFGTTQGIYTWHISADRLYKTPAWRFDDLPIPLSLDQACQASRAWLAKHDLKMFSLIEVKLSGYPDGADSALFNITDKEKQRFFYQMTYRPDPPARGFMYVFVLLDGTVVEPKLDK